MLKCSTAENLYQLTVNLRNNLPLGISSLLQLKYSFS